MENETEMISPHTQNKNGDLVNLNREKLKLIVAIIIMVFAVAFAAQSWKGEVETPGKVVIQWKRPWYSYFGWILSLL